MNFNCPYKVLNISPISSIEEVKRAYRKIALKSHPDKLNNIDDINEKNIKIKEFTDATNAYNKIINNETFNFEDFDFNDYNDWNETFDNVINSDLFSCCVVKNLMVSRKI